MSAAAPKAPGRFKRPSKISETSGSAFNAIIYGAPGVGKTTLAATAPGPVLFLDCDQGLLALRNPDPTIVTQLDLKLDQLYTEPIRSLADITAQIHRVANECATEPGWWGSVVLDNLTELQRVLVTDLLRKADRTVPQIQDWNVILLQMQLIVRSIRNLPCNSIFLCHEKQKENEIGPAMSGQIALELAGYVDILGRLVMVEKEVEGPNGKTLKVIRKLRCRRQISPVEVLAKSRSSRLSDWEEPHIGRLILKTQNS